MPHSFPALVTVLALVLYVACFITVGRARGRFGIKAPAVTGAPEFERAFRIQQNTIEQLVVFLPALWLFALYVSPRWGGVLGLIWIGGRAFYAVSYYREPENRGPGFIIAAISTAILLVGSLFGIAAAVI
jgi:uncharacterized membrane protein YecN with MAPEG domain